MTAIASVKTEFGVHATGTATSQRPLSEMIETGIWLIRMGIDITPRSLRQVLCLALLGNDQSWTGVFINGSNATTIQGSGDLASFTFNFTYSKLASGVNAGGTFSFTGTPQDAAQALQSAGYE